MTAKEFLTKTDGLSVKKLSRDDLHINEKGESEFHATIQDSIGLEDEKQIGKIGALFKNLDSLLKDAIKNFEEKSKTSFRAKYEKLPKQSEVNKIFKNVYRISKLIRNAETHNENSMKCNGNIVEIRYKHLNTDFFLKFDKDAYFLLEKIIYEFVFLYENNYSEKYQELLLGNFYELIKEHFYLSEFKDDIEHSFFDIKPCPKVNVLRRCACHDLEYSISEKRLVFNDPSNAIPNSVNVDKFLGVDIWVNIQGKDYIFPSEILDKNYSISLDESEKFVMEKYAGWAVRNYI
ncbi:MAG: hypothetical protein HDR32_07755 [Treponema sp.]|nr:hypothetical protein [Treponema sp.]